MNKRFIFFTLLIATLVSIIFSFSIRWINSRIESTNLKINGVIGENRFLKETFKSLLRTDSINIDSIKIIHGENTFKLKDVIKFPCLIIHLPSTEEDICSSCLTYALNEAKENIHNFSTNMHVCIISVGSNPEIKERIYKKTCYTIEKSLINTLHPNMPYYFILNKDGKISQLYNPNYLFKEYTNIYWEQMNKLHIFS